MTHPYAQYESTQTWTALDTAITELERNGDLIAQTARRYIVGYLCKVLAEMERSDGGH